jgi:hypothetical protein
MTLEVKVEFDRVNHITVDNRAGNTIPASVTLIFNAREEANVVPLANDDESDGRLDTQFDTRIYVNVRSLHARHWGSGILRISGSSSSRTVWNCPSETPSEEVRLLCAY